MIEERSTTLKEKRLEKALTGINGLDDITYGGLPKGRPTLVMWKCGLRKDPYGHGVPGQGSQKVR